jgi:hypothetical protein
MKKARIAIATVVAASFVAAPAFAEPVTTVAGLWNTISFTDVIAAVFGIGALVIGVDLAQLGYQKVRRLVKGAH